MRYWPVLSLTAVRTFSISAGLLASTVTPGRMAPELSLTVPAITACAAALVGRSTRKTQTASDPTKQRIWHLHVLVDNRPRGSGANLLFCREKINRSRGCRCMTFPVLIPIGGWRVHPHVFFEVLAYAVAAGVFLWIRRRRGDALSGADRLSLVTAIFVGALVGSRLLAWFDSPGAQMRGIVGLMDGKTLVGGLVGGWIATEVEKRRMGVRRPTGDLYVFPVIAGIAIGRIGCLLSGLPDGTYGTATTLPWGIAFGVLLVPVWRHGTIGHTFKWFTASYLAFRLLVDTIKPGVALFLGLTAIQWACVFGLLYYAQWYVRLKPDTATAA